MADKLIHTFGAEYKYTDLLTYLHPERPSSTIILHGVVTFANYNTRNY